MSGKVKTIKPRPAPAVGGSWTLNPDTGEWLPTGAKPPQAGVIEEPTTPPEDDNGIH